MMSHSFKMCIHDSDICLNFYTMSGVRQMMIINIVTFQTRKYAHQETSIINHTSLDLTQCYCHAQCMSTTLLPFTQQIQMKNCFSPQNLLFTFSCLSHNTLILREVKEVITISEDDIIKFINIQTSWDVHWLQGETVNVSQCQTLPL